MSKIMSDAELQAHITDALNSLKTLLDDFLSNAETGRKQAMLLGYWIKTYVSFLRKEKIFNLNSLPRYKRGSIIQVDFGYRVGSELGGLHYAVVLNIPNNYSSNTITVVPLSSLKHRVKVNMYQIKLKDGVYKPLSEKAHGLITQAELLTDEATKLDEMLHDPNYSDSSEAIKTQIAAKVQSAKILLKQAEKVMEDINHLKDGSIALVGQITTISKIRIKRPINKDDMLYNLRLSAEDMDEINNAIKNLYIF